MKKRESLLRFITWLQLLRMLAWVIAKNSLNVHSSGCKREYSAKVQLLLCFVFQASAHRSVKMIWRVKLWFLYPLQNGNGREWDGKRWLSTAPKNKDEVLHQYEAFPHHQVEVGQLEFFWDRLNKKLQIQGQPRQRGHKLVCDGPGGHIPGIILHRARHIPCQPQGKRPSTLEINKPI